jgi:hypothetical protein
MVTKEGLRNSQEAPSIEEEDLGVLLSYEIDCVNSSRENLGSFLIEFMKAKWAASVAAKSRSSICLVDPNSTRAVPPTRRHSRRSGGGI